MNQTKILLIGSGGQVGQELAITLRDIYGYQNVITSDIKPCEDVTQEGTFVHLDATQEEDLATIVKKYRITQIYHLAAILSGKGEKTAQKTWHINMQSLLSTLQVARTFNIEKVFWPSSIAVYGASSPKNKVSQHAIMDPSSVYGISKRAGELWCAYYYQKYKVDVRSIRYPGLIGWKTKPEGGTTDYAVDMYHQALRYKQYTCFLSSDTCLPMMYMNDAIRATLMIMEAPMERLHVRTSYNVGAMSFTPAEMASVIQSHIPDFIISYKPDYRQAIASTWPCSIDDSEARSDWGWEPHFDLHSMTHEMLENLTLHPEFI